MATATNNQVMLKTTGVFPVIEVNGHMLAVNKNGTHNTVNIHQVTLAPCKLDNTQPPSIIPIVRQATN